LRRGDAVSQVADPANAAAVANFRAGNQRVLGAIVAKVLAASGGKANPSVVNDVVVKLLAAAVGGAK
jgi:Asp-tRNA(Asn)/Glu-tRNA(Gln) amidotransferase B subunit